MNDEWGETVESDGLYWISCSPWLLAAMQAMELDGYRTCDETPRRPGGLIGTETVISHFHGVPMPVAVTWDQYRIEGFPVPVPPRTTP